MFFANCIPRKLLINMIYRKPLQSILLFYALLFARKFFPLVTSIKKLGAKRFEFCDLMFQHTDIQNVLLVGMHDLSLDFHQCCLIVKPMSC